LSAPVTVVMVSWNTRELLGAALRSLAPDVQAGRADVWVVDNGSTDESPELVRDEFPWARLELPSENLGFGPAVNLVAERTDSEWIAPANSDIVLEPPALRAMLAAGAADAGLGVVAPRLVLMDGSDQPSLNAYPGPWAALAYGLRLFRLRPRLGDRLGVKGYWDPLERRTGGWPTGAFFLVRRSAYAEVGGFDPAQWLYAEDLDLGWRLERAGWRTATAPAAVVHHFWGAAADQAFGNRGAMRSVAASYGWMARRRGLAVTWTTAAVGVATAAARAIALAPLAVVRPERWRRPLGAARRDIGYNATGLRSPRALASRR
jgi:GT2 family glycosyltransferase